MTNKLRFLGLSIAILLGGAAAAQAQEVSTEISDDLVCLRYVRGTERAQQIPQGLLTAIAYIESGRQAGPGNRLVPWPWTINAAGRSEYFESKQEAVDRTLALLNEGIRSIDVGCMQINLRYHPQAFQSLEEAFDPLSNVSYGAQHLTGLRGSLGSWPAAVERYHSSDNIRREEYRERVLAFWEDDARLLILDEVEQEDRDTPYHRAYKDFVAGRYVNARLRYQNLLDEDPQDKVALLGLALTAAALNEPSQALASYEALLVLDPVHATAESRVLEVYATLPAREAEARLDNLIEQGVNTPTIMATRAEYAQRNGNDEEALTYFAAAADGAPSVAFYQLNSGILADRLGRSATALGYYETFMDLYRRNPIIVETSVDGVQDRITYLRTRL